MNRTLSKTIEHFCQFTYLLTRRMAILSLVIAGINPSLFASSDGKIAFASDRDGQYEIYVMNPDGSAQTRLTFDVTPDTQPAFSRNSMRIAYVCASDICIMNADGTNKNQLTFTGNNTSPALSPDGNRIAFISSRTGAVEIYIMGADGSGQTRLTTTLPGVHPSRPVFIGNSSRIGFVAYGSAGSIIQMNSDGSDLAALPLPWFTSGWPLFGLSYNADGTKIVTSTVYCCAVPHIVLINADGSNPLTVFGTLSSAYTNPDFSPDGTKIVSDAFVTGNGKRDIIAGNIDGSGETALTTLDASDDLSPSWGGSIENFSFTGFLEPVQNRPTLNLVTAGRSLPIKFSLNGDRGSNIFADGYPASRQVSCGTGNSVGGIEESDTAGNSTLHYDPISDQYNYVWKTEKAWKGTCRQFMLKLSDLTIHSADFRFK